MAVDKKRTKKIILITKLIKVLVFVIIVFIISFFSIDLSIKYNNKKKTELEKIISDTDSVKSETNDIDRRIMLTKKYIDTWNNIITEKQKEKDGIDIESVKQTITSILSRYPITNINMSFSIPEDARYDFKKVISIMNTEITLSFNCLTEYDVYHFLSDLYKNKDIFFVIETFNIKRTKNITKDFIKLLIDNGIDNSLFFVDMKIQWYEFSTK